MTIATNPAPLVADDVPMSTPLPAEVRIRVRNLTKRYRTPRGDVLALNNVSMTVNAGEKLVLLGPSGCGKTTLLRCVAGLEQPDEGEIEINGTVVFSSDRGILIAPEKRGVSMVFQSYALWPHMTVFDNVAFPLTNARVPKSDIRDRVRAALAMVGCAAFENRFPGQLSGGQQQRIALARAIVSNSGVILFDEPLSNVDAKVREQLRIELVSMQKKLGFSALYVTHDQTEATAVAHRIAVMNTGSVAQIGSPYEIYERPDSRYVADFVGATNEFPGTVAGRKDGLLLVDTDIGRLASRDGADFEVGQSVVVLIRPENLHVTAEQDGLNVMAATLESTMFLGLFTEYVALVGDKRVILRSMRQELVREGGAIGIGVHPEHVRVFR
ncbi:ABC transporter ATP-binding protein [Azospirillum rugosum]|uniref:Iron(III) transport system ATP-binding protein n=1 Tax=Azospirillum rugosum TaxID=416170 RepID=A0ABS4SQZ3_9PROT|nr:ABC transporter ATP-binding protein [Azospirillum rugosum]MBP2294965.1 iron(III) transport system ATP-binding protein [Azospirillum rugosum]MDQ0530985.1 iron(III) transport system ATP-binding protein [Azospirillum rugosum]